MIGGGDSDDVGAICCLGNEDDANVDGSDDEGCDLKGRGGGIDDGDGGSVQMTALLEQCHYYYYY